MGEVRAVCPGCGDSVEPEELVMPWLLCEECLHARGKVVSAEVLREAIRQQAALRSRGL